MDFENECFNITILESAAVPPEPKVGQTFKGVCWMEIVKETDTRGPQTLQTFT